MGDIVREFATRGDLAHLALFLWAAGASALAVVCVDEGEELRRAGIDAPVLVVGYYL